MVMVCSGATLCPIEVVTRLGFPQAYTSQKDQVRFVLDKRQAEVVLDLEAVNPRGPVPAELLQGFDDGEAGEPNTALRGAITPHLRLACDECREVVDVGPRFVGRLVREFGILRGEKRELQIGEMLLDGTRSLGRPLQGVLLSQGG